ncbi:MAG TPA: helix-turn-helix domain-containing protein [Acidimicrobiales bacterium]|nr:helix-turn-helix domain-containing protein [Acidimicrobiales bacterium]
MGGLLWNRGVNTSRYWFTVPEAAQYTGIDEATIRKEIRDGNLQTRRLKMNVVIVDAELERWVRVRFSSHVPAVRRSQIDPKDPLPFSVEDWLSQTDG